MIANKLVVLQELYHLERQYDNAQETAKEILRTVKPSLISAEKDRDIRDKLMIILKDTYTYRGKVDFESFLLAMEWDRDENKRFYLPRKPQLRPVVAEMQRLADGELDVLVGVNAS